MTKPPTEELGGFIRVKLLSKGAGGTADFKSILLKLHLGRTFFTTPDTVIGKVSRHTKADKGTKSNLGVRRYNWSSNPRVSLFVPNNFNRDCLSNFSFEVAISAKWLSIIISDQLNPQYQIFSLEKAWELVPKEIWKPAFIFLNFIWFHRMFEPLGPSNV